MNYKKRQARVKESFKCFVKIATIAFAAIAPAKANVTSAVLV